MSREEGSKKIFSDYFQEKEREEKKKTEVKDGGGVTMVLKEGLWSSKSKQLVQSVIRTAHGNYRKDLDSQLRFIHFHLEDHFGKRLQILIHEKAGVEGHALYASSGEFMEVLHEEYVYVVWRVRLIEDIPEMKEF